MNIPNTLAAQEMLDLQPGKISAMKHALLYTAILLVDLMFASASSVTASISPPQPVPTRSPLLAQARTAIDYGNAVYIKAWETADPDLMISIMDRDAAELAGGHGQIFQGRRAIRRRFQYLFAVTPAKNVTVTTQEMWVVGDRAYETGKYMFDFAGAGGKPDDIEKGQYVTVWKRQADGGWKIIADMGVPSD